MQSAKRAPKQYPKPPEGTWTEHYPELGTAPVSYESSISTIRKHIVESKFGRTLLVEISTGKIDLFLTEKERELSPQSVNHLRGYLRRALNLARRMEMVARAMGVAVNVPVQGRSI